MKYSFIIFLIFLISCSSKYSNRQEQIKRIKISAIMPVEIINGYGIKDTLAIFASYFNKYRIYELHYHNTMEVDNKLIYDSSKYDYFINNSDKDFGYFLKNISDSFIKKINSDSILCKRAFCGGKGQSTSEPDTLNPILIVTKQKKSIYKLLPGSGVYDSLYFYYDDTLTDIDFSWSKHYDSMYNSKLYKIEMFIHPNFTDEKNPNLKDYYISSFEIKSEPVKNEEELKKLFDRFIEFDKRNEN
jgi:hypothetical protein